MKEKNYKMLLNAHGIKNSKTNIIIIYILLLFILLFMLLFIFYYYLYYYTIKYCSIVFGFHNCESSSSSILSIILFSSSSIL